MMEYKGYLGKVEFDDEAGIFHGEVVNTRDVITFEGETVTELRQAFHDSVKDYLSFCAERGESPDKPFSGQFITRVSPELHRKLNAAARLANRSLNSWIAEQLDRAASELAEQTATFVAKKTGVKGPGTKQRPSTGIRPRKATRSARRV
jgi:predicted HicB family RNase H-like nuclease